MVEAARLLGRLAVPYFPQKLSAGWNKTEQKTYPAHLGSEGCGDHRQ